MHLQTSLQSLSLNGVSPETGDAGEAVVQFKVIDSDGEKASIEISTINGEPVMQQTDQPTEEAEVSMTKEEMLRQAQKQDEEY